MDTPASTPQLTILTADDYREQYANSVMLKTSLWDFCFLFGRIDQTNPQMLTIRNSTAMYISPQQAKALQQVLNQNIESYEKQFGAIAIQPIPGSMAVGGKQFTC